MARQQKSNTVKYRDTEVGAALAAWMSSNQRLHHDLDGLVKMLDIREGFVCLPERLKERLGNYFVSQGTKLPVFRQRSGRSSSYVYQEPEELIAEADEARDLAAQLEAQGDLDRAAEFRQEENGKRERARLIRMLRRAAAQTNHRPRRSAT